MLPKKEYDHELIIAFWYAVHCENLEMTRHIVHLDVFIKELVAISLY